jgi:P-type conjugative transfer protein TrbJ
MPFLDHRRVIAAMLAAAASGSLIMGVMSAATPAHAQFGGVVFDPSNYAQNILTAARTLQSVNQQIRQLQNEAEMLIAMGKNLKRIDSP